MKYIESKILANQRITDDIFVLKVAYKEDDVNAGQFFMLKSWDSELTLMRPISVFKAEEDALWFMYRTVGQGTRKMAELKRGGRIRLLGPCGNGYPCGEIKGRVAVVGGGVGIPPLCHTSKLLHEQGTTVDAYLGYRDEPFAIEDFEPWCTDIFVSTEHGEEGYRGFVTDLLHPEQYDVVIACGPEVMMRKVAAMCAEKDVTCYCSLEHRMACGIGACLGCSIRTKNGMKRVCKDGPVFQSTDLMW